MLLHFQNLHPFQFQHKFTAIYFFVNALLSLSSYPKPSNKFAIKSMEKTPNIHNTTWPPSDIERYSRFYKSHPIFKNSTPEFFEKQKISNTIQDTT